MREPDEKPIAIRELKPWTPEEAEDWRRSQRFRPELKPTRQQIEAARAQIVVIDADGNEDHY